MSTQVVPAIPASQIVNVVPSVLSAGGTGLALNGVMLTANPRVPMGTLQSFADEDDVAAYFGSTSQEAALAAIYFGGFDNSQKKPGQLFFWQYAWLEPVGAYLRGGSLAEMTLAELTALSGTISVTVDGVEQTANVNLSAATSFSNAAQLIGAAFDYRGVYQGSYTGSIASSTLTVSAVNNGPPVATVIGSISGTTLTVTSVGQGTISVGDIVTGTGVTGGTTIAAFLSGVGGVGTYQLNQSMTVAVESLQFYSPDGALEVGSVVTGTGFTAGTYISSLGSGTGGIGTYGEVGTTAALSQLFSAFAPVCAWDPTLSAFVISSGTTGSISTIGFGSGGLATSLNLTQALGAVTSQGAAQSVPATAMDQITAINQNWALFMTLFEPVDTDKEAFATWTTEQDDRYGYAMWDTNVLNTESGSGSSAVVAINLANDSGTCMIYEDPAIDTQGQIAGFVLGYAASIDFTQVQGRASAAFKSQAGLLPQVFDGTTAQNILDKGMNFYGTYTTADDAFTFLYNGSVSGPFRWLDSYIDQIWFNSQLQLAGMVLLTTARSIPFNQAGAGLIQAALLDPTLAAVQAGVIQPGVPLSALQAAEVNADAGVKIDNILSTRGWYIQVNVPSAQVRQNRGPWPVKVWYTDGESVNSLTVDSILIQ